MNMKVISTISTVFLLVILSLFSTQSFSDDTLPSNSQSILNINTANAQQISAALKGIGLKKAQAIVEYRENYGNFTHVDELTAVKGIGKSTLEKNVHLIGLE
jgi:competence protein ComEA